MDEMMCDTCGIPQWIAPTNRTIITPPNDTMAIIVDVRVKGGEGGGAFFIHEKQNNEYVDMVGMDHRGELVMVIWDGEWCYYTVGSLPRIGYIGKREEKQV